MKAIAHKYFEFFSIKNIEQLDKMFSDEIVLSDPNIHCIGKKEVLNATQNIFNSAKSINIKVKDMYAEDSTVIAELEILMDENDLIKIVDILKFDKHNKIMSINAYKM